MKRGGREMYHSLSWERKMSSSASMVRISRIWEFVMWDWVEGEEDNSKGGRGEFR